MWNKKSQQPESNRMIEVRGFDWSDYRCKGMFVPYKPGSGKRTGKARFMRDMGKLGLMADRDSWVDAEEWRYLDKPAAEERE